MNDQESVKKISLICSKGGLEEVYPSLILANGARMEGIEAAVFFTFFGLNAIVKKTHKNLKVATVGNAALNLAMPMLKMPLTTPFPTLVGAMPGVSKFATWLMKRKMEKLDIPPVGEFLEMLDDAGAKIYACQLTVDMYGLTINDFVPQVKGIMTVGEFYEESAGAQIVFT
ncbi:MAG: DsrE/DsrF/DrsH-like family protein [Candidatus Neomarinimicrobiota bacterium]